ncbi:MAG: porin, partial [Alphaproteobacteria bacterium]|nr:porin [Alphaproteobacteria bacterium]
MKKSLLICASIVLSPAIVLGKNTQIDKQNNCKNDSKEEEKEKAVKQEDSAEKPQLIVSGAASVHSSFGDPDITYYKGNPSGYEKSDKDTSMTRISAGDANIEVKAVGKLQNETQYMAVIDVDVMKGDTGVDKLYVSFSRDGLGTFQVGNVKGPGGKCVKSGQQLLGGTGGLDGTVPSDFDFVAGMFSPINMIGYSGKATKGVYYTPRIYGLQAGIAITPDTKQVGHEGKNCRAGSSSNGNDNGLFIQGDGSQKPSDRSNIELGLTYEHTFQNGIGLQLSGVYVHGSTRSVNVTSYTQEKDAEGNIKNNGEKIDRKIKLHNTNSYFLSGTISYDKWSVGAGYLNNGKSRTPKDLYDKKTEGTKTGNEEGALGNGIDKGLTRYEYIGNFLGTDKSNAGRAWNFGLQYRLNDNWTFSGVFHQMRRKVDTNAHTKGNAINLAAEYKVCDGLKLFAEYAYISTKSCEEACARYNAIYKEKEKQNAIMK